VLQTAGVLAAAGIVGPSEGDASQHAAADAVYPDDAFSRPYDHHLPAFETLSGCSIAWDIRTRAAYYASADLRLDNSISPSGAVWRFRTRTASMAVLFVQERIRRKPEALSFNVTNRSGRPVTFTIQVHEQAWVPGRTSRGVAWELGEGRSVGAGQEALLRYRFADARRPSVPGTREPLYPLGAIVIAAQGIEPGTDYEVLLRQLTVHHPPAAHVAATRLAAPSNVRAGDPIDVHVAASGSGPLSIELRRDPWVLWRTHLTADETHAALNGGTVVRRIAPWHLPPGDLTMGLVSSGYRVSGPEPHIHVHNASRPPLPLAERRRYRGRRTFFLDGKPTAWQGYSSYDYQPGNVAEFGRSGTNVMCVPCCAGQHVYHIMEPTWVAPGRFDFGELDESAGFALEANPNAILFFRVNLALPAFWTQEHPKEITLADMEPGRVVWQEQNASPVGSYASEEWRRDQAAALRELIRHCKAQPWASRVAGFWLAGGTTEEWFAWGSNEGYYTDYSAPAQAAFAVWHRRQAPAMADGDGPAVPAPALRRAPGYDIYPGTPEGAMAAAYNQHESDLAAETIARFARVVKEETGGRSLACTFYGYVLQLAGESRQALSGTFALRRLLAEPDVDVLAGIPLFEGRDLTNGYTSYVSAYESIQAAGKLYCNENDLFSWLHHMIWYTEYDPKDPRGAAISMHRRVCAQDAVVGGMAQKFSLSATWHHDAVLQRDFALQRRVYAGALNLDRTPAEEVAFVVDDSTFAWTPPETQWLGQAHKQLLLRLARTGAPVGVWLLSDLPRLPHRVRFVVIASGAAARPEELAAIRKLLAAGGRTVVAVGPIGLVDRMAGRWRPEAVGELFGLPIRVEDKPLAGAAVVSETGEQLGGPASLRPRAHAAHEGALRFTDGASACAARELAGGGKLIWCAVPPCSSRLLRGWLSAAGVHLYAPQEYFVHASRELVAITAPAAGTAALRWPRHARITDLFDGWSGEGEEIACPFVAGQTRLFRVASAADRRTGTHS
jgi:hypothetical protein